MSPSPEFDYKKYLNLLKRRKGLYALVALVVMTGAVMASYVLPKKFQAKSTVFIEKSVISDLVKGIAVTSSVDDKIKVLTYAISSRAIILKVIDELDLNVKKRSDADLEEMIKTFQKNLEIKLKDKEGLFFISFVHENPRVARDFVNTLVRRYIEENVSSNREGSYGATQFLSEQISSFKEKLDKAEAKVNDFRQQRGALLTSDEGRLLREISDAQQKLEDLRIRRSQVEATYNILKKVDPLRAKLTAMQKRLAELRVEYTDNYPDVVNLKADIETAAQQIQERSGRETSFADPHEMEKAGIELKSLRSAEDFQRRSIAADQGLLRSIPTARAELEALERDKNNQKVLYDQLVARHGQSEVSKQMEVQDKTTTFRIVDPAIMPTKPVSPNRVKIILLGIVAGLAAGMGILFLLDQMDRSVKSLDALKSLGVPVLAVIPKMLNPAEVAATRKKDRRLYVVSAAYFLLILAVLAFETAKSFSIDSQMLKQNIVELKNQLIK